jgi:uncharacterized membrane protein YbjE (DUF340 family)
MRFLVNYKIKIIGKIFVIFIELYKKWTFVHIKGKKLLQKPGEKKATLESSQKIIKIFVVSIALAWKGNHFVHHNENNSLKCQIILNFRIKSEMCK